MKILKSQLLIWLLLIVSRHDAGRTRRGSHRTDWGIRRPAVWVDVDRAMVGGSHIHHSPSDTGRDGERANA
jgi:hypothetical protein